MAPTVPWGVPASARAGDTWLWKVTFPDYPSSEGWTPKYAIRGKSALTWQAAWATESGGEWTITIPAASTGTLGAGAYEWAAIVTGSATYAGREHTVETGRIEVLPDLEAAVQGDRQPWAEKTLAVIEAVLSGRVTSDISGYTIGGRQVIKMPIDELVRLRTRLRAEVMAVKRGGNLTTPVEVYL